MDFASRDGYRHAIEALARGSKRAELDVTRQALAHAGRARARSAKAGDESSAREADPGYYLVGNARREFEEAIGFREPFRD